MKQKLKNVYWIGGGSGAGKSTIAKRIADRHGFYYYSTDDVMPDHGKRTSADESPYLRAFKAMDMDERWVNRSPSEMLETFHWFNGEGFRFIVEDLLSMPSDKGVVVEGFRLLPYLVRPWLAKTNQAVWLIPTPEFRKEVFEHRPENVKFYNRTSNPAKALNNLLERDKLFSERIKAEATEDNLHIIELNKSISEENTFRDVEELFRL